MIYLVWCEDFVDEEGATEVVADNPRDAVVAWARELEHEGEPVDVDIGQFVVKTKDIHGEVVIVRLFANRSIDYAAYIELHP